MSIIGMAVFSTEENGKDEYLEKTLQSLKDTVDFSKHTLGVSVNGYTEKTVEILRKYNDIIKHYIYNDDNIGTAEAVNKVWKLRAKGESAVKMDDDIVIHNTDWLYLMEEAVARDNNIGQIGLKRRDCSESTWNENPFYKSEIIQLPHVAGQKWLYVERVNHVMGSVVMHSSALLDKVKYLWQPGLYGFDDVFMSLRSQLAGFKNVFLCGVDIEHIDRGDTPFQKWKEQKAGEKWEAYKMAHEEFTTGKRPIYYNPYD